VNPFATLYITRSGMRRASVRRVEERQVAVRSGRGGGRAAAHRAVSTGHTAIACTLLRTITIFSFGMQVGLACMAVSTGAGAWRV